MLMHDLSSRSNVIKGSPLNVISDSGDLRVYFQAEGGSIKVSVMKETTWLDAT